MNQSTAEIAVDKICAAIGSENTLLAIAAKLNGADFTPATLQAFLEDVNLSMGSNALDGNLANLSVNILDSWSKIDEALRPTNSKLRRDWETLGVVKTIIATESAILDHMFAIINASTDVEIVNAKNGPFSLRLETFIKRYATANCTLCENPTTYGVPTLVNVWANAKYMLGLYDAGLTDAQKLLNGGTFLSKVFSMQSGTNHMITDMRTRNLTRAELTGLDNAFTAGGKEYDLKRNGNGGFIEYKSYTEDYGMSDISGIGSGSWKDFDQFLAYLSQPEVTDLNGVSLEYVFNAKKIPDSGLIKEQFRKMMYNSVANTLTEQGTKVFDVVWANVGLRESLFPGITDIVVGKDRFETMVADPTLFIYSFIKVK